MLKSKLIERALVFAVQNFVALLLQNIYERKKIPLKPKIINSG